MFFGFFGDKDKIELKPKHKKFLNDLIIDDTNPSTLLHDFQSMLEVLQQGDHKLTANQQLKLDSVRQINESLKKPLDVRLQRQTQKSYPTIEGLYLLLRASGLSYIETKGKTHRLKIDNDDWLAQWNAFNLTEKYCHLLETWIMRAHETILNERSGKFGMPRTLDKILSGYRKIGKDGYKINSYQHFRDEFSYYPETYNLALMDLFGIVKIHEGKPLDGDGWQLDRVEQTQHGEALLALLSDVILNQMMQKMKEIMESPEEFLEKLEQETEEQSEDNITSQSISILQPYFEEYFPAWKKTLTVQPSDHMRGHLTFAVSLSGGWSAEIVLDAEQTFDTLAHSILMAVKFDSDHLYQFVYQSRFGEEVEIVHPYADGAFATNEVTIGSLAMREGFKMVFIFDFGDWWEFDVVVKQIQPNKTGTKIEIANVKGEAPEQYPSWDDDDDNFESFATGFDFFGE
ncbi:MAG: hypothetical protein AAF846_05340 [Chloroflexota bacterium]